MPLPVTIPNTFANATSSIPLSQLDANFGTLANAVNDINSGATTLVNLKASNATITGGTISNVTLDNVTVQTESFDNVTMSNVTITSGNATFTNVTATQANLTTANIATMQSASVLITGGTLTGITAANIAGANISSGNATFTNVTATQANLTTANVSTLQSSNVQVTGGSANNITFANVIISSGTANLSSANVNAAAIVNLSDTQTLTNKTLTDPAIIGTVLEDIFTITDGAAFEVDPGNGSIQLITLGASRTPKATNFAAGESITLMVDDGSAYTITWTDSTWGSGGVIWETNGGVAPTLATSGYTTIVFWKVSTQVYGARVGDA